MFDLIEPEVSFEALEREVASHYGLSDLHVTILRNLAASGFNIDRLMHDDLAPIDEFHLGGRAATHYLLSKMTLAGGEHVLDVGSGLGGPSRCLAVSHGCKATGLDLTPEYVAIARDLTARVGLASQVACQVGSALKMPFPDAQFDAAISIHAAMNVRDRLRMYTEVARVLRPGGVFAVYDIMTGYYDGVHFPVPWAGQAQASHLLSPTQTGAVLGAAGFLIEHIEERRDASLESAREQLAALSGEAPLLGLHLLLGANARQKMENMVRNLEEARVMPVIIIVRRSV